VLVLRRIYARERTYISIYIPTSRYFLAYRWQFLSYQFEFRQSSVALPTSVGKDSCLFKITIFLCRVWKIGFAFVPSNWHAILGILRKLWNRTSITVRAQFNVFLPELPLARRWSFRKYRHASSSEAFNLAEIWIPNQRLFCECKTGVLSHVMWDVVRCRRWFNAGFYLLLKMIQQFLDALGGNSVIFYTSDCPYLYVLDIRFLYIIYILRRMSGWINWNSSWKWTKSKFSG